MSKYAKLKIQVFTSVSKLPQDAELLVEAKLIVDVEWLKNNGSQVM